MEQPLLIPVELTSIVTTDQLTSLLGTKRPKASTLNLIRARARAVRPL
ncbi:MAG: hypothetical protein IJK15_01435 [Bacteroidaceae bacterium]|nr:hypothetical protein [Bacteroidaceae bacterium]MBR0432347.1 hypothetical protein [Bacteroidaceae bacterium]